ncbi:MAG: SUMF1/EgtB/PvdO family nonheme iron enzyme [Anaerolineaceae bacterium]|nr:SUMF1/EgtB/PvdO family nonheme iron enzyme [Anaerolineaceae bacterium]
MHIFISYAKSDTRDLALHLRDTFTALPGVTAWMDTSLHSGEDWASQIQDEIDRADLVVVLLSQDVNRPADHPNGRSFVLKEIHYAQQGKKTIFPVMAQKTRVPVQIAGIEYIDFTRDSSSGIQRLIREITTRAGIPAPTNLSPAPSLPPTPLPFSPVPARPKAQSSAAASIKRTGYRRPAFIIGFLILVLILAAAVILPSLNAPALPLPTSNISLFPSDSPLPARPTDTATLTSTATPQPTSTDVPPTATLTPPPPTSTPTPTFALALTAIARNTDWVPQFFTFSGYEMALVPVGCFLMGSTEGQDDEKPVNPQCFDQPFWIDRYEVTNKQFGSDGNIKGDNHPRDSVTWFQARDFCVQRGARLPTEREWEYAARGPSNLVYPWGNDFLTDRAVYSDNSNGQSAEVGSRPAGNSWVGASDLSGNLVEWVSSIYELYPYIATDGRESNENTNNGRALHGGSWFNPASALRASFRRWNNPLYQYFDFGFRCARSY